MTDITARLLRRLERHVTLPLEEKEMLEAAASAVRRFDIRDHLATLGTPIDRIFIIVEGIACRYKLLPDGRRQILAFLLPGDICDTRMFSLSRMDHSICALSPVDAAVLSLGAVEELQMMPALSRALAWSSVVQQSIMREWMINLGHRTSFERLSHLLCETFERLQAVGLTRDYMCELPLTQTEIADTLALSSVHVNRTLMELRRSGLVTYHSKLLVIHDYPALKRAAGFDAGYLHLGGEGEAIAAA